MTNQKDKINEWLTSRPGGQDVTPEAMHTLRIAVIAFLVVLAGVFACGLSLIATAQADGAMPIPCPGPGSIVRVIPGAGNNLRPNAGGNIAGNAATKTLHFEDGEFAVLEGPVHLNGDDWLRVEGGWMWSHSLSVVCATATPTATRTATATSTPRATSGPQVTPTRIERNLLWCKRGSVTVVPGERDRVECDTP